LAIGFQDVVLNIEVLSQPDPDRPAKAQVIDSRTKIWHAYVSVLVYKDGGRYG